MNKLSIKIFEKSNDIAEYLAEFIISKLNLLSDEDSFCLVVSGGNSPKNIFSYMALHYKDKINWSKIKLFWVDERCVSPKDIQSNYRMVFDSLISKISIPLNNIFRIMGEENPITEAKRYSAVINQNVPTYNGMPRFDLVLLGIGEDGHTASIFPNNLSLFSAQDICAVTIIGQTNQNRITITGRIINNADTIFFISTGKNKADIISKIVKEESWKIYPASLVNPKNGILKFLLDKDASFLVDL